MGWLDVAGFFSIVDPYTNQLKLPFAPAETPGYTDPVNTPTELVQWAVTDPIVPVVDVAGYTIQRIVIEPAGQLVEKVYEPVKGTINWAIAAAAAAAIAFFTFGGKK